VEVLMSPESCRLPGILLVILPTVVYGGVSLLRLLIGEPGYMENQLQDLGEPGTPTQSWRPSCDVLSGKATDAAMKAYRGLFWRRWG
jgi:hypothetical protein